MKLELNTLKFFGIFLVINSHLDLHYPNAYFATGGALGNTFFFLTSSIAIYFSLNSNLISFKEWYFKRFKRIYPKLFIILLILISIGFIQINNINEIFFKFLFPKDYWFLPAIMIFYIPVFFIIKKKNLLKPTLAIMMLTYFLFYIFLIDKNSYSIENNILFKCFFYFSVMLIGIFFADNYNKINLKIIWSLLIFFISFLSYYFLKYFMLMSGIYYLQLLEHAFIIIIVTSLLLIFKNSLILDVLNKKKIKYSINLISGITLEMYLIHLYFSQNPFFIFPINIILMFIIVITLSILMKKIFSFIKIY